MPTGGVARFSDLMGFTTFDLGYYAVEVGPVPEPDGAGGNASLQAFCDVGFGGVTGSSATGDVNSAVGRVLISFN